MISASKEFKEKLKSGANVVNYADFILSDGTVLHLEPKDFMIGGCTIEDKTTDGKFGVGFVIGKTLTLRIANHDERFSKYDFYNSIINLYVAILLDNGTIEKIRKGIYYTLVPETPGDIIEISAVDGMYKLDKDYAANSTVYPATLQKIITDVCLDCGIPIGFTQFDNMSFVVQSRPESTTTYRQVLSWACQIAGYNARIDNDGYMRLVWYDTSLLDAYSYTGGNFKQYPHDTVIDGGNFKDYSTNTIISGGSFTDGAPEHIFRVKTLNVHTDDVQITGIKVIGENEASALFGEDGYVIEVNKNPFADGKEQFVADYLGARMVGMVFRPFSAEILNNPLYEPFDIVRVSDTKENTYVSFLNSVSYKIGEYTDVACEAEDPVRNGSTYVSPAAQAVVEARRNTQKQISEYDKAVQNMNELAANGMGLFRKEELQENGSSISYESDRPITVDENGKCHFEPGSHVWMKSDAGFFVSEDGGKTYTAGFDKNNNAVLNVLYAIGIVADWIKTGRLEIAKNGKTMVLMDFDTGQVILRPDVFELSSGQTIDSIAKEEADKKCKTFTSTPVPPYNVGDIWMNSTTSDIMTCITARSSGSYVASDWQKRNKYIDQTAANTAANNAVNGQTQADIFNRLTNNGKSKGIILQNGELYVNATYINTGEMVADRIKGGELAISGTSNGITINGKKISFLYNDEEYAYINALWSGTSTTPGINISSDYGGVLFRVNSSGRDKPKLTYSVLEVLSYEGHKNKYGESEDYYPVRVTRMSINYIRVNTEAIFNNRSEFQKSISVDGSIKNAGATSHSGGTPAIFYGDTIYKSSSSSKRYKRIIKEMEEEDILDYYNISPVIAMYKPEYLSESDERYGKSFPMFIAENVEKYAPLAVDHNEKGQADNWNYKVIIPIMFQMIKSQKDTIDNLARRLERLESILLKGGE